MKTKLYGVVFWKADARKNNHYGEFQFITVAFENKVWYNEGKESDAQAGQGIWRTDFCKEKNGAAEWENWQKKRISVHFLCRCYMAAIFLLC